jgi:hypothetical protein
MRYAISIILVSAALAMPSAAFAQLPNMPPPAPPVIMPPPPVAPAPVPPSVQLAPPPSYGYGVPSNINSGPVLSGGGGSLRSTYRTKRPPKRLRFKRQHRQNMSDVQFVQRA